MKIANLPLEVPWGLHVVDCVKWSFPSHHWSTRAQSTCLFVFAATGTSIHQWFLVDEHSNIVWTKCRKISAEIFVAAKLSTSVCTPKLCVNMSVCIALCDKINRSNLHVCASGNAARRTSQLFITLNHLPWQKAPAWWHKLRQFSPYKCNRIQIMAPKHLLV